MTTYCHKAVREIAKDLAGAAYEDFCKNDEFYRQWPNQNLFIAKRWKSFVGVARSTLVYMLGQEHHPQAMRDDLLEIIIQDRTLQDVQRVPATEFNALPMQGNA